MNLSLLSDTIPPQNLEMEQAVIGCMLIAPEAIDIASKALKFTDFYREAHGVIFAAIGSLHRQGVPVDLLSVQERLRSKGLLDDAGGTPYLVTCMDSVPCWQNIEHYCAVVKDKSLRRQWAEAFVEAASQLWASPDDFDVIREETRELLKSAMG